MAETAKPELVDLARGAVEAFNARDVDGLAALLHPDVEFHSAIMSVEGRVYRGPAETAMYIHDIDGIFDDWRLGDVAYHAGEGSAIVVTYRVSGTARQSGIPIDFALALLWYERDGLLVRGEVHTDRAEALRKAGVAA
jgi:ketosteroid isomerase-like protein